MSVLIINMEMPNTCKACVCSNYYERMDMILCDIMDKQLDEKQWKSERHHDCPLISIPTPHGRLGDLDALRVLFADWYRGLDDKMREEVALRYIDDAPTVIEAED